MNLISGVQSVLRLQLYRTQQLFYAKTIGTETSGLQVHIFASGIVSPYRDKQSLCFPVILSSTHS